MRPAPHGGDDFIWISGSDKRLGLKPSSATACRGFRTIGLQGNLKPVIMLLKSSTESPWGPHKKLLMLASVL